MPVSSSAWGDMGIDLHTPEPPGLIFAARWFVSPACFLAISIKLGPTIPLSTAWQAVQLYFCVSVIATLLPPSIVSVWSTGLAAAATGEPVLPSGWLVSAPCIHRQRGDAGAADLGRLVDGLLLVAEQVYQVQCDILRRHPERSAQCTTPLSSPFTWSDFEFSPHRNAASHGVDQPPGRTARSHRQGLALERGFRAGFSASRCAGSAEIKLPV